jgi:hypothetical protein
LWVNRRKPPFLPPSIVGKPADGNTRLNRAAEKDINQPSVKSWSNYDVN